MVGISRHVIYRSMSNVTTEMAKNEEIFIKFGFQFQNWFDYQFSKHFHHSDFKLSNQ